MSSGSSRGRSGRRRRRLERASEPPIGSSGSRSSRQRAEETEVLDGDADLGLDRGDGLADVARLELRELFAVRHDRVRERVQEPGALVRRRLAPGAVERRAGSLDGAVDVGLAASAARASGSPVAGSLRSRISPDAGSTTSPPMKSPYSCPAVTAIGRNLARWSRRPRRGDWTVDFGSESRRGRRRCRAPSASRPRASPTVTGCSRRCATKVSTPRRKTKSASSSPSAKAGNDLLHQVEGVVFSVGAPFVPIEHEGVIYIRPPVG